MSDPTPEPAAWALAYENGGAVRFAGPDDMRAVRRRVLADGRETAWSGHAELGDAFTVTVRWTPLDGGLWSGAFEYAGLDAERRIDEIHFPVVRVALGGDTRVVGAFMDLGAQYRCVPDMRLRETYASLQCCALLGPDDRGVYIDHRDPEWRVKHADVRVSADGAEVEYRGVQPLARVSPPAAAHRLPYACTVGPLAGGWYGAARIYRSWASEQSWSLGANPRNPLREIGLWVWNRGLIEDVVPPVEMLQRDLPGVRVALDWYWWHHNPYDTDYPDFWPPREGVDAFRAAVRRLDEAGIFSQVYVNGICWDLDGPSFAEGGADEVVVNADGTPLAFAFNVYNRHRLGYMCGSAPRFHDRLSRLVGQLRACGLSGQYLDQIGICAYTLCHHPGHDHPPGDDLASRRGYRRLMERLRAENPGFPFTTECANESYMDLFDGGIVCTGTCPERLAKGAYESVPLFTAVHHGRYALFGSYAFPDGIPPWDPLWPPEGRWRVESPWHRLYPDQFYIEMARAVVWGAQPMVCNLHAGIRSNPEMAGAYRFILDTARFYHANRDLLFDGEMLPPDGFRCEEGTVEFHGRTIFTKENECPVHRRTLPRVLHSVWRSPEGRSALVLANYTAAPQPWRYRSLEGIAPPRGYRCVALD